MIKNILEFTLYAIIAITVGYLSFRLWTHAIVRSLAEYLNSKKEENHVHPRRDASRIKKRTEKTG